MNYAKYLLRIPVETFDWFIDHAEQMGESLATIFRRALREYKSRHTR